MSVRNSSKIQKLVVNAIRKLQDVQGSTPREISNYISQEYDVPSTKVQRQVRLALARAASYGILQRAKGGYYVCNRDPLGCQPQMEDVQLTEKCASRRSRGHAKRRARSRKSRRRKGGAAASCGRRGRRRAARRSRKRSRRGGGGRRCGTSGGGKKSRRRRGRRSGRGKKSSRRGRRRRSGRRGKKCPTGDGGDGRAGSGDELDVFGGRGGGRRARSHSATRKRNNSGSSLSGSFDDERLDDKRPDAEPIDCPESLLDRD